MSDPKAQEPSMEEILASIRRIISEDGATEEPKAEAPAAAAPAPQPQPPAPEPEPEPEPEDVLELTETAEEEAVVDLSPRIAPAPVPETEPPGPEPLFDEQKGRARPPPPPAAPFRGLVSEPQANEAISHFSELATALEEPVTPIGAGYKTLEEMTKEVMRPMLKAWLDEHLPGLVERLVQEEIERMVQKATRR
jgi:cell pole-organizing protein PopZ